jgi:hypothetical protein
MHGPRVFSRMLLVLLATLSSCPVVAAPARAGTHYIPGATTLQWIRVSPANPRMIYAGGRFLGGAGARVWLIRSTDAGNTWQDLSDLAGLYNYIRCGGGSCSSAFAYTPLIMGADGVHLYAAGGVSGPSPASGTSLLYLSADRARSWTVTDANAQDECDSSQYGGGPISVYADSVNPLRIYTLINCGGGDNTRVIKTSGDGGRHWQEGRGSSSITKLFNRAGTIDNLVVDPIHTDTVYANLSGSDGGFAARSDDAGLTWTALVTPTAVPALASYAVASDPRAPGLLEAHATNINEGRRDLIFQSSDQGRSWRDAQCPGDLDWVCPTLTLANLFGNGHNYALFSDGIHAFDGTGPSGPRLALSDNLPMKPGEIKDIEGGSHMGDPIYLEGSGKIGSVDGVLYRSTDAGSTWQKLPIGMFPPIPAAVLLRGSHAVSRSTHRVAAPFLATYRKLGTLVLGIPITDPFVNGGALVQYFEHMRLELIGGRVRISELGSLVYGLEGEFDSSNLCLGCIGLVQNSVREHIFTVSSKGKFDYPLSGAFLRFRQTHGGKSVFGAPISPPFTAANGDGSSRRYTMQYFEHARLELHPENRDPAYRIELGLLGDQYLKDIGWLQVG